MKRTLSLLLVVIVISSFLTVITSATTVTQEEAVDWIYSKKGKSIDFDGAYGYQCLDPILAYCDYLGVGHLYGNAKDYAWNNLPKGWVRYKCTENFIPQPGDIAVFTRRDGHVALVISADKQSLKYLNQNYCGHNYCEILTKYPEYFDYYIRPNFGEIIKTEPETKSVIENKSEMLEQKDNGNLEFKKAYKNEEALIKSDKKPSSETKIIVLADNEILDICKNERPTDEKTANMRTNYNNTKTK